VFELPEEVRTDISIDITGPFVVHSQHYYVAVMVDCLSRFVWGTLLEKMPISEELFGLVLGTTYKTSQQVRHILSDNGPKFRGKNWSFLCAQFDVQKHLCSNHFPQADGITERAIQTIKQKMCLSTSEDNVHTRLYQAVKAINSLPREPLKMPSKDILTAFKNSKENEDLKRIYEEIKTILKSKLLQASEKIKQRLDSQGVKKRTFMAGEQVF
jgi:transposase InsO family protein